MPRREGLKSRMIRVSTIGTLIFGLCIVGGSAASELTISPVQKDGLAVALDFCVMHQSIGEQCEKPSDDAKVRFTDLPAGNYSVYPLGDPMWHADPVEIELIDEGRHAVTFKMKTYVDFDALASQLQRGWRIRLDRTSVWGGGSIDIFSTANGGATARTWSERSPDQKSEIELTSADRDRLVDILERAQLFSGQYAGTDARSVDLSFDTLRVENGRAVAMLVTSGNPAFSVGARRELMLFFEEIQDRFEKHREESTEDG